MAGIAESLLKQVGQAGQPRIAKSTTTTTGKEAPNIGMLGLLLAMLLEGEQATPPAIPPEAFGPTGGLMPATTTTPVDATLPALGLNMADILAPGGLEIPSPTATPSRTPTPSASRKTTLGQEGLPTSGLDIGEVLSQIPGLLSQEGTPTSGMTLQQLLDLIIPQTAMPPVVPSIWGSSWRK